MMSASNANTFMRLFGITLVVVFFSLLLKNCNYQETYRNGVTAGQLQQSNQQLQQDLKDAEVQNKVVEVVQEKQQEAVVAVKNHEVKVVKEKKQRVEKVEAKIKEVTANTVMTEKEKDQEIASAQIEALWEVYCASIGSECKS